MVVGCPMIVLIGTAYIYPLTILLISVTFAMIAAMFATFVH